MSQPPQCCHMSVIGWPFVFIYITISSSMLCFICLSRCSSLAMSFLKSSEGWCMSSAGPKSPVEVFNWYCSSPVHWVWSSKYLLGFYFQLSFTFAIAQFETYTWMVRNICFCSNSTTSLCFICSHHPCLLTNSLPKNLVFLISTTAHLMDIYKILWPNLLSWIASNNLNLIFILQHRLSTYQLTV